jgi:diguanylate cyclase (GGDEF)-like protein/PAS domain S-box-containing protein
LLNDAAKEIYGVTDVNYAGKYCYEVFWESSHPCDVCPTLEVMRTGKTISAKRYFENDTVLNRINSPVHDSAGNIIGCAVIASDVTEQEKHLKKLKRFEQIISTSNDLVAFYDKNHTLLASNQVYADYFGIDFDTIVGRHASEILGSERYEFFSKFQEPVFKNKESLQFKLLADYPHAGKRHMEISFTPYIDEDGTVSGVVSRSKDITHKTEQEAKLRLSAKVFESTIEGITITDKDGNILAVNKAFCTITGYSEADVLGENPRILKSGRHGEDFYKKMWTSLAETGMWRGEIWNKNKAGRIYPELLTISSILDDDGNTLNYVAVFSDITSIRKVTEQLEYQAHHHPLTGLPNRVMLHIRLEHSIQHAKRERERGAVLFLDLDNFKKINDSLGHGAGDEVLKEVALRLQQHSREVDTVSHLSGDEFVVILQRINSINDALIRAQQILDSLQEPFNIGEYELYISASIGITEFSGESDSIEGLLKNADTAMYKAKEGGKNCYHLYSPDLTDTALEKVLLETHLRRAIERNELVLYYQPQVTLPAGDIVAVEALVRWQHPDLGLISPDKFISLSEETGLIIPMGEWILKTACRQLLAWRKQGYGLRRIAVNLSGKQIQQKNLLEMVERILLETGCPSGSLELEITEGFIMQHPEQSISVLQQIRDLGVELSVDDFGTGHSSLNYLKRLPINRLKIDRSFVWDINENPDGEAIIKAVIAMGHSLSLQITAEGIETPEQRKFLEDLGCNEVQGYLFSRPLPAGEVEEYLKQHY